jgi:hypothetical protein
MLLYYVMLCYVMLCYVMLCYVMVCYFVMLCLLCSLAYFFRLISQCIPHALLDTLDEVSTLFRKFRSSLPLKHRVTS